MASLISRNIQRTFINSITKRSLSTVAGKHPNNAFISTFIITALNPKANAHQLQQNNIWMNDMYRFCSKPYADIDTSEKNESKPQKSYIDTEELQQSKINVPSSEPTKKSKMQMIKEYGAVGLGIYCTLWFGMYGVFFSSFHWNFVDITTVAKLIPFAEEKINNALSSSWGEAAVALVMTEALEVIRLPFVLMITPPIAKFFKK